MKIRYINTNVLKDIRKKRDKWVKKYDYGHLLIVGGNYKYSGAITLSGLAALRSGVDLVTIIAPERAANIAASISPNLITEPLKCKNLNVNVVEHVLEVASKCDAVACGMGTERKTETLNFFTNFIEKINLPCVLDAGATYAMRERRLNENFIILSHSYEFYLLTGKKVINSVEERARVVIEVAKNMRCVIVLKGAVDIISNGNVVFANKTGSPYMTKAGTGDVLAGICGAMLAMGFSTIDAAKKACYLCGLAGEIASKKFKQGLLATDVINSIPEAIYSSNTSESQ